MSENTDSTDEQAAEQTLSTTATPVLSSYKILGEFSDGNGAGVLGQNNASSGTPVGVQGSVPNTSDGYGLASTDGARVEGALELGGDLRAITAGNHGTAGRRLKTASRRRVAATRPRRCGGRAGGRGGESAPVPRGPRPCARES